MTFVDNIRRLYLELLQKYEGGTSSTSTKKFVPIVSEFASLLKIPVKDIYATGSANRPGNLEVRLNQGERAKHHTKVGLGFLKDEKNTPENTIKITNSAFVTCEKFIFGSKANYDNIVIFVESNGTLKPTGICCRERNAIANTLITSLEIPEDMVRTGSSALNAPEESGSTSTTAHKNKLSSVDYPTHTDIVTALRVKPFMLLAGISGTGKSRIVRKLAQASVTEDLQRAYDPESVASGFDRWKLHKPANFELVPVKANWHNSLEVIGYKSNISGAYEFTPFVEFVVRAWQHQDVPFFVCFDEMNLAPVEQYFSEFLSAIETRSFENDEYETDPLIKPFELFGDSMCKSMLTRLLGDKYETTLTLTKLSDRFRTKGLTIPKNLLILGTVNMDDTTFSFSRKVLDRAMSVLMNEVVFADFFAGKTQDDLLEMDNDVKTLLIDRPIDGLEADHIHKDEVEAYLTALNSLLEDTQFKLGYRAANEALLYVSAAHKFNPAATVKGALDEFTLMKVLSRIEGNKRLLGNLLDDLQKVITIEYPKANAKLRKMAEALDKRPFVSYWT